MVSVTMPADPPPPPYNPNSGILVFPVGSGQPSMHRQIDAYYEANFRQGQMETFAQMVIEKGHGAMAPLRYKNGQAIRETWQAVGRRLFGERFILVMERAVVAYRAAHSPPPPVATPEPPAHVLEDIPEPEF